MCPPIMACIMVFLPWRVGLLLFHRSRSFLILSSISSHGVVASVLFPIQAPRDRTASPSLAI